MLRHEAAAEWDWTQETRCFIIIVFWKVTHKLSSIRFKQYKYTTGQTMWTWIKWTLTNHWPLRILPSPPFFQEIVHTNSWKPSGSTTQCKKKANRLSSLAQLNSETFKFWCGVFRNRGKCRSSQISMAGGSRTLWVLFFQVQMRFWTNSCAALSRFEVAFVLGQMADETATKAFHFVVLPFSERWSARGPFKQKMS